jgi:hypothetical protein
LSAWPSSGRLFDIIRFHYESAIHRRTEITGRRGAGYHSRMSHFPEAIAAIFDEAMTADYYRSTWFRDTEPDSSFVLTLDQLTAAQASAKPTCGRNSVVAHARHVLAYVEMMNGYMRGEEPQVDWEETWSVQAMDEEEWASLRSRLRAACDEWRARLAAIEDWSNSDRVKGVVAGLAHSAYHLGAMRQIASEFVRHA